MADLTMFRQRGALMAACALILQALAPAQAAACTIPTAFGRGRIVEQTNLPYTTHPNEDQALDLYLPTTVTHPPLVVAIHGGAFSGGSKAGYKLFGDVMASFGIATAAVNYRKVKGGTNLFPTGISDTRCAVSWLHANAARLGIDGNRIAVYGGSAGGNFAGLVGTHADPDGDFDITADCASAGPPPAVLGVADYFGLNAINLHGAMNHLQTENAKKYLGVDPRNDPALAAKASPLTYVATDTPPFFIARGTADTVMPRLQAIDMIMGLQAVSVPVQFWEVPGLGHGFDAVDVATYPQLQDSACALVGFFQGVFAAH